VNWSEDILDDAAVAELIEDAELRVHPIPERGVVRVPSAVSFLTGFDRWTVEEYDGVAPIVRAHVAAAVRRRDGRAVLRTTRERVRDFMMAPLDQMKPETRQQLVTLHSDVETIGGERLGQPHLFFEAVGAAVRRARSRLERELAEQALDTLEDDEWLVLDGLLSRSPVAANHPRVLGVVQSRGAQFLAGMELERALTLPAGHRTSVFLLAGGHTRTDVYSWYLRLWSREGKDLLHGLLRIEARAHEATVRQASELSGWLFAERAPLATLYPLHHVEEYLRSRAGA
jgi:hypothetical protein